MYSALCHPSQSISLTPSQQVCPFCGTCPLSNWAGLGNLLWWWKIFTPTVKVVNDFYGPFKIRLDYANETIQKEVVTTDEICAACAKPMVVKWSRKGKFLSCSDFPACRYAKSITTGIKCPQDGCSGELIERHSRRGLFYGCTGYPKCTYIAKTLPEKIADSEK